MTLSGFLSIAPVQGTSSWIRVHVEVLRTERRRKLDPALLWFLDGDSVLHELCLWSREVFLASGEGEEDRSDEGIGVEVDWTGRSIWPGDLFLANLT